MYVYFVQGTLLSAHASIYILEINQQCISDWLILTKYEEIMHSRAVYPYPFASYAHLKMARCANDLLILLHFSCQDLYHYDMWKHPCNP